MSTQLKKQRLLIAQTPNHAHNTQQKLGVAFSYSECNVQWAPRRACALLLLFLNKKIGERIAPNFFLVNFKVKSLVN